MNITGRGPGQSARRDRLLAVPARQRRRRPQHAPRHQAATHQHRARPEELHRGAQPTPQVPHIILHVHTRDLSFF